MKHPVVKPACLNSPIGMTLVGDAALFVADDSDGVIRRVAAK